MKKMKFIGKVLIMQALGLILTSCSQKIVTYEEFGAVGDGVNDDLSAIVKAHDFANEHNLEVRANDDATYYIGGTDQTAIIQTNTDFGKAKFLIDDRDVKNIKANIFKISSKLEPYNITDVKSLKKNQADLGRTLPHKSLIVAKDSNVKRYIRYGANADAGADQFDVFIADKDGKIQADAPIMWDFDNITELKAFPMDEETLTVNGGVFTTIANSLEGTHSYFARGIDIERSNTLVTNLTHYVENEGEHCFPYFGFVIIESCADVTVENALLTGHKTYYNTNNIRTGTYDILITRAIDITFKNCRQTNDITDDTYWGIMGSNYSKNLIYDNCKFSRFDAHMGVYNATIRNSELGHMGVSVVGKGTLRLENTKFTHGNAMVNFRDDYGSTWEGEVIIKDCVFVPTNDKATPSLFIGSNNGQHDFGYETKMPKKITIENLVIEDVLHGEPLNRPVIFGTFNSKFKDATYVEKYPFIPVKEVILDNVKTKSNRTLVKTYNSYLFRNTKVTEK